MMKLNEIRERFIKFFVDHNHRQVPSSPLVPKHDATLMFTNAGMVQFKDIFTGVQETEMKRAVSSQRCFRAGGKHNDLENVGYTTRHHTLFEMLGNFSFGDYFKETAIELAWKFLTQELCLDKNRLSITVHLTDGEAYEIWQKVSGLSDQKIMRVATDDNFWSMGSTGPCGPCSEIFYDHANHHLHESDRTVEIWNLVFMEFNKNEEGNLQKLPRKCIDTGMGLERIAAAVQNVHDNYDTDLFSALISKSQECCKDVENKVAHKIIVDHLRASAFLIAEGVVPGNEGRNYVLRRLIRRAARYIHQLGCNGSLLHRIFSVLMDDDMISSSYMGAELIRAKSSIEKILKLEEENFKDTLIKGVNLLDKLTAGLKSGDTFPGESAFKLYDTYGFPLDITLDFLKEREINFDQEGFDHAMKEQKERVHVINWSRSSESSIQQVLFNLQGKFKTEFVGHDYDEVSDANVLAIISTENEIIDYAKEGKEVTILLDKTPFYGESCGQVGDAGEFFIPIKKENACSYDDKSHNTIRSVVIVQNTNKVNDLYLHKCVVKSGLVRKGDTVIASIDKRRRQDLRRNHSATHLLHFVLRKILGNKVTQKGSLITPDRLRFDFSYNKPVAQDQLFLVEDAVNSLIRENLSTLTKIQDVDQATNEGAIALFGEKYGKKARVVKIGDSKELCYGTHVKCSGEIGLFKISAEYSVASGIRRIEALTSQEAINYIRNNEIRLRKVGELIKVPINEVINRVSVLIQENKEFKTKVKNLYKRVISTGNVESTEVNGVTFVRHTFDDVPWKIIREFVLQQQRHKTLIAFMSKERDKTVLIIKVSQDLVNKINAKDLASAATRRNCGGSAEVAYGSCDSNNDVINIISSSLLKL